MRTVLRSFAWALVLLLCSTGLAQMHHDFPGGTARVSWSGQNAAGGVDVSIEAMFYLDALPATTSYIWHNEPGVGSFGRFLGVNSAGQIVIGVPDNAAGLSQYRTVEAVALGRWYHVVATIPSNALAVPTGCRLYIKGGGFTFTTSTGGATEQTSSTTYTVGNRATDGARPLDGRIRRVRCWKNVILTSGQADDIHNGVESGLNDPDFAPDASLLDEAVAGSVTGAVTACNFGSVPTTWFNVNPPLMVLVAADNSLGAVSTWPDRALNAAVTQGTAANRPNAVTDLTGRRAVLFHEAYAGGGLSDRFMSVAGPLVDRQNVTFVFIGRIRTLGEAQAIYATSGDSSIFGVAATGTSIGTVSHGSWNTGTLRAQSSTHVAALVSGSASATAYVNAESASVTTVAAGTATGGRLGQTNAGTNNLEAHVYELHVYQGQLTAASVDALRAYAIGAYGVPAAPTVRLVANGSSTPKGWNDWTYLGMGERIVAAFPRIEFYNFSIEGRLYSDAVAAGTSDPANREDSVVKGGRRMVLLDGYGSNDWVIGGPNLATFQANATAYAAARRTAGYTRLIKIIPQPRDFGGGIQANHETRLTDVVTPGIEWLKTAGIWNRYIDPARSASMGNYAWGGSFTGPLWADTTHWNTNGFTEAWSAAWLPTLRLEFTQGSGRLNRGNRGGR